MYNINPIYLFFHHRLVKIFFLVLMIFNGLIASNLIAQERIQLVNKPEITPEIIEKEVSLSWDGKTLIFVSNQDGMWKLYSATITAYGFWEDIQPIETINNYSQSKGSIHSPSLNYNGTQLYFAANFENDGGGMNIYVSEQKNGTWTSPIKLDKPVNTELYEGSPSISPDGKTLYFVRNNPLAEQKDYACKSIYVTYKNERGRWSEPELLPSPINLDCEEDPKISYDGKTLYFSSVRKYKDDLGRESKDGFDLYYTKKLGNRIWLSPIILDQLSTDEDDRSPTLSAFGELLYYHSGDEKKKNEKKRFGSIYKGTIPDAARPAKILQLKGKVLDQYSKKPVAAQFTIRNPYTAEKIAVYHNEPDSGRYNLFFPAGGFYQIDVSNPGYSHHIFHYDLRNLTKSRAEEKNIGIYAQVNLLLNTYDHELFESLASTITIFNQKTGEEEQEAKVQAVAEGRYQLTLPIGKHYRFHIEAKNYEPLDYLFDMREVVQFSDYEEDVLLHIQKEKVALTVHDQETNQGLSATIEVKNKSRREDIAVSKEKKTGIYSVALRKGDQYEIRVQAADYAYASLEIDREKEEQNQYSIALTPIKKEQKIVLNNITFELNSADLLEASFTELDQLVEFMQENEVVMIELSAHTDDRGNAEYNLALSEKRAEAVMNYLIAKGIATNRLSAKGYGETIPLVANTSEENRAQNRRVEMKIIAVNSEE